MKGVKHGKYTITKWKRIPYGHYQDIEVPILTSHAIENGRVHIYFQLLNNDYISLPLRYPDSKYSSTIDAVYKPRTVRIIWSNTDKIRNKASLKAVIAVVIIPKEMQEEFSNVNYRRYQEVRKTFRMRG